VKAHARRAIAVRAQFAHSYDRSPLPSSGNHPVTPPIQFRAEAWWGPGAMKFWYLVSFFCLLCTRCASFAGELVNAAETLDTTPRTALMSAYQPEWIALQAMLRDRKEHVINATIFAAGTIEGKPVVLFLSGVSMVPSSQIARERLRHSGNGSGCNCAS
jgi:hypothetical protein